MRKFRDKIHSWGSATSLRELGLREDDLPWLVEHAMTSPRIGSISKFGPHDVEALLLLAF